MVIVTHESYDSVLVGTEKQKCLESFYYYFIYLIFLPEENLRWRKKLQKDLHIVGRSYYHSAEPKSVGLFFFAFLYVVFLLLFVMFCACFSRHVDID